MRTQRELKKYQQKIDAIKEKVEKNPVDEYKRVLITIKPNKFEETFEEMLDLDPP